MPPRRYPISASTGPSAEHNVLRMDVPLRSRSACRLFSRASVDRSGCCMPASDGMLSFDRGTQPAVQRGACVMRAYLPLSFQGFCAGARIFPCDRRNVPALRVTLRYDTVNQAAAKPKALAAFSVQGQHRSVRTPRLRQSGCQTACSRFLPLLALANLSGHPAGDRTQARMA